MSGRVLRKGLALFATLAAIAIVLHETDLPASFAPAWGQRLVESHGALAPLLFVAAGTAFTGVGLPRQAMAFAAGYSFGVTEGVALAIAATTLGCVISFFYARFLGREMVRGRYPERVRRIDRFLAENPFSMTLLIRFLPVGNNLATNLAAGVSSVPAGAFIAGSAVGYLPQTAVFALIGGGTTLPSWLNVALGAVLFVASGVIGVLLYRRYRQGGGAFDDAIENELVPEGMGPYGPGREDT